VNKWSVYSLITEGSFCLPLSAYCIRICKGIRHGTLQFHDLISRLSKKVSAAWFVQSAAAYLFRQDEKVKTLGLLGGFFYEDTEFYRWEISDAVYRKTNVVPHLLVQHTDYDYIQSLHAQKRFFELENCYIEAAEMLQNRGAEGLILCSDILHKIIPALQTAVNLPIIDYGHCFVKEVLRDCSAVYALLDEQQTMDDRYYRCQFHRKLGHSRIPYLTQQDIHEYLQENPLVKSCSQSVVFTYKFGTVLGEYTDEASCSQEPVYQYVPDAGPVRESGDLFGSLEQSDHVQVVDLCFHHIGEAVEFIVEGTCESLTGIYRGRECSRKES